MHVSGGLRKCLCANDGEWSGGGLEVPVFLCFGGLGEFGKGI